MGFSRTPYLRSLVGTAIISVSAAVSAVPVNLTIEAAAPRTVGPQNASAPCIISATHCQNGSFAYTNFDQSGNVAFYDLLSPIYPVSDLPFLQFRVAIDVNTAGGGEFLNSFTLTDLTTNTVLYTFVGALIGSPLPSNGNGYADWLLSSFDLSSLALTDQIQFHAVLSNSSDGPESFFLVAAPVAVPEPQSYALLLAGLGVVGFMVKRRRDAR